MLLGNVHGLKTVEARGVWPRIGCGNFRSWMLPMLPEVGLPVHFTETGVGEVFGHWVRVPHGGVLCIYETGYHWYHHWASASRDEMDVGESADCQIRC